MAKPSRTTTTKKKKTAKAPAIDKLLVPAIGVCLALMGYQFFTGMTSGSIDRVDVNDDLALKEIFFAEVSGKNSYAVLCHADDDSGIPVSSVFSDACTGGSSPAQFRLLDCNHVLPDSEKTIAERFKLDLKKRPTIFVSGLVGEPKQVPSKHLKTGKMLDKLLKNMLEPRAAKIDTTQDLRTKCLNQPTCGLLLKGSKSVDGATKKAIQKLLVEQPKMVFASIDSSNLYIKGLEHELPELTAGRHRFVVFKKVSGGMGTGDARLVSSYATIDGSGVSYGQMSNLCADVLSGKETMTKVATLPMVKTRSKKLEAEERAKRDRKSGGGSSSSSAPSSSPTANDGTKEGRRAERERRRKEHLKETGGREKTPEEIKEMERQRRLRMEAAQDAWTVQDGDDDLPPEGEPIGDDYYTEEDDEEEDDDDGNDDDDEDVMDLD